MSSILIVAGENSGEKHGANLVQKFKHLQPSFTFYGIGGKNMAEQGVTLLFSVEDLAVVGIFEVLTHLPRISGIFHQLKGRSFRYDCLFIPVEHYCSIRYHKNARQFVGHYNHCGSEALVYVQNHFVQCYAGDRIKAC